jgi:hypothetical protein
MALLGDARIRLLMAGGLGVVSYVFADQWITAFIFLLILFGLWNALYLLVVPRTRFIGGVLLLVLSGPVLGVGTSVPWVGLLGGLLFGHGSWLALVAAARLDE